MNKTFIVYMATNTVNGKRYVGATKVGIEARRIRHFKDSRRKARDCPRFYGAIRKYGLDAFEWETLVTLSTLAEMYQEEERLIALLKPEYNIASGGLVFTSKENQARLVASRARQCSKPMICLNDGRVFPSATAAERFYGMESCNLGPSCQRGSIARNGLSFAFFHGPMSDEERNEILSARKAKKAAAEVARVKKVTQINSRSVTDLNTGIIYKNARAADKALNLVLGTADSCCRRKLASRNGECFAFGELSEQDRKRLLSVVTAKRYEVYIGWKEKLSKRHSRIVICTNTNRLYGNATVAADEEGLSPWIVRDSCRSGKPTRSGISFVFLDEWCPNPE